jgi:hypothetical protein
MCSASSEPACWSWQFDEGLRILRVGYGFRWHDVGMGKPMNSTFLRGVLDYSFALGEANSEMNTFLSWLAKWLVMMPLNVLTVLRWYRFGALKKGPRRTALIATVHANRRTSRPVIFRRKGRQDHPDWPAYIVTLDFGYVIFVDPVRDGSPYSTVHEVLHLLLTEEGYPWPSLPENALAPDPEERLLWLGGLANALHHPEIYRRMEEVYRLPMEGYWVRIRQQAIERIKSWAAADLAPGDRLTVILFTFSWAFLPEAVSAEVMGTLGHNFFDEQAVCVGIRALATEQQLNICNPDGMREIGLIVRNCCLKYSAERGLPPRYDQALEAMTFQSYHRVPLSEFTE